MPPKKARELTAIEVKRLTRPGMHAVGEVAGLLLRVKKSGTRSWVLRVLDAGRRRDIGLGGYPDVPLAEARARARQHREDLAQGVDPIVKKRATQAARIAERATRITFDEAARRCLAAKAHEFRNAKHAAQWENTLQTYASPVIGQLPVAEVELPHIIQILEPIWTTKTETASRLRGRIEAVLAWATVGGYRTGDNPARWKGHLDAVLAKPSRVAKVKHHRALPVSEIGAFMTELRKRDGMAARALEFAILTAARSGEVRGATWQEIDLDAALWTIPAERMKAGREHRVPLSPDAVTLLRALPRLEGSKYVFVSPRGGSLSDMALASVMKRMGVDAVPHGFRSTFRDWCAEHTNYPRDVAEMALAHAIGDKVEAAYRRGDLMAKRVRLMNEWAKFCGTVQRPGDVVPILDAGRRG